MNKQELIEKYKELENSSFDIAAIVVCQLVLKDLEQLDEPKPVKVKQFVADWYEENKGWLPKSKEFDDWIGYSPSMAQVVIAVYLIYRGN
ncbi:gp24 [Streptococcus pneumoniae]|nr:gp24 [Streptococcus pneumoniae]